MHEHLGLRINVLGENGLSAGMEIPEPVYCLTKGERAIFRMEGSLGLQMLQACGRIQDMTIELFPYPAMPGEPGTWLKPDHWKEDPDAAEADGPGQVPGRLAEQL